MLNHTRNRTNTQSHKHTSLVQNNVFFFLAPYARTSRYEEAFFPLQNQEKKDSLRSRAALL